MQHILLALYIKLILTTMLRHIILLILQSYGNIKIGAMTRAIWGVIRVEFVTNSCQLLFKACKAILYSP